MLLQPSTKILIYIFYPIVFAATEIIKSTIYKHWFMNRYPRRLGVQFVKRKMSALLNFSLGGYKLEID